jgi:hypothetical protein
VTSRQGERNVLLPSMLNLKLPTFQTDIYFS